MKAYFYISIVTDLLRADNTPIIRETEKDLFSDYDDYLFSAWLRFMGIKENYPTAQFHHDDTGAMVTIDGVVVYDRQILYIEPTPVDIEDDHEFGE